MADGSFGERIIDVDLSVTGARVLRDPLTIGKAVKVSKVLVSGTSGAAPVAIVLRKESASGPIVAFWQPVQAAQVQTIELISENEEFYCKGLYLDNISQAWTAPSHLLVYTR